MWAGLGEGSPAKGKISSDLQILHFTSWQNTGRCLFRGKQRVNVIFCRCLQSCLLLLLWALCWSLRPSDDRRTLQRADRRTASVSSEAGEPGTAWSEGMQHLPLLSFQHLRQLISRQVIHRHAHVWPSTVSTNSFRVVWKVFEEEDDARKPLTSTRPHYRLNFWPSDLLVMCVDRLQLQSNRTFFLSSHLKPKTRRSLFLPSSFFLFS